MLSNERMMVSTAKVPIPQGIWELPEYGAISAAIKPVAIIIYEPFPLVKNAKGANKAMAGINPANRRYTLWMRCNILEYGLV